MAWFIQSCKYWAYHWTAWKTTHANSLNAVWNIKSWGCVFLNITLQTSAYYQSIKGLFERNNNWNTLIVCIYIAIYKHKKIQTVINNHELLDNPHYLQNISINLRKIQCMCMHRYCMIPRSWSILGVSSQDCSTPMAFKWVKIVVSVDHLEQLHVYFSSLRTWFIIGWLFRTGCPTPVLLKLQMTTYVWI